MSCQGVSNSGFGKGTFVKLNEYVLFVIHDFSLFPLLNSQLPWLHDHAEKKKKIGEVCVFLVSPSMWTQLLEPMQSVRIQMLKGEEGDKIHSSPFLPYRMETSKGF